MEMDVTRRPGEKKTKVVQELELETRRVHSTGVDTEENILESIFSRPNCHKPLTSPRGQSSIPVTFINDSVIR